MIWGIILVSIIFIYLILTIIIYITFSPLIIIGPLSGTLALNIIGLIIIIILTQIVLVINPKKSLDEIKEERLKEILQEP